MTKLKGVIVKRFFILGLLIVFISGCGSDQFNSENEVTVPVSVEAVKLKPIEQFLEATGTLQAESETVLRAEISGNYKLQINPRTKKTFSLGDFVKKDEAIIKIEDKEYLNSVRIDLKKLQMEEAKSEYDKQKSLYDRGGVTFKDLKSSELDYLDKKYTYDNALLQLEKTKIKAPFGGIIVDLPYYTQDTRVSQNSPMAQLMSYKKMFLEINLPEKQLTKVKTGQRARITNYTVGNDTLTGIVNQISPAIDAGTRTFKTVLSVSNPSLTFRPGMFVKVQLITAKKDSAIVIPKNIILSRRRGKTVFVVIKGASQERVISTGLENPEEVEVLSGLEPEERVVVKGFETLRSRQKVKIIK
ncbi:MAG: efflux RND transporter periplasmic adaptor subunit [Chlorobi bacterium]|nr:efflux RND transporter periplasmic adaptor subunit [Chlorobiota bacterium]